MFPRAAKCPLHACVLVRLIREAINALLPVAQIGGEIAGVRVMTFFGMPGELAGATVLVDILLQAVTLLLFTLVGIGILATVVADRAHLPRVDYACPLPSPPHMLPQCSATTTKGARCCAHAFRFIGKPRSTLGRASRSIALSSNAGRRLRPSSG